MKFLRFWFPVISYSAMIFYVSGLPNLNVFFGIGHFDKLLHIGEYAILGFLFARALAGGQNSLASLRVIGLTLLFVVFFGAGDEWHQSFVPGRDMSGGDLLADCVGGLFGAFIYLTSINHIKLWHR